MALVVIEGVDQSGKSTLARNLASYLRGYRPHHETIELHFDRPEKPAIEEYLEPLLPYNPVQHNIIVDRHYLGEAVWPTIFDRESRMSGADRALIELFLINRGALLVWCQRKPETLYDADWTQEPINGAQALHAQILFREEYERSLVTKRTYDHALGLKTREVETHNIASAALNMGGIAANTSTNMWSATAEAVRQCLEYKVVAV